MKTITKKKTAKTALTKSVFRQFNRKTAAGRRETVAMLAERMQNNTVSYEAPETAEIIISIERNIMSISPGVTLSNFGEEGAAGGTINEENIVNGGIL